jgi:hypothetical protein
MTKYLFAAFSKSSPNKRKYDLPFTIPSPVTVRDGEGALVDAGAVVAVVVDTVSVGAAGAAEAAASSD